MTPEQIQELIDTLLALGETMATSAYQIALERIILQNWVYLITLSLVLLVGIIAGWVLESTEKDGSGWFTFITAFLIFILFAPLAIINLLTPEWSAIEKVMELIP